MQLLALAYSSAIIRVWAMVPIPAAPKGHGKLMLSTYITVYFATHNWGKRNAWEVLTTQEGALLKGSGPRQEELEYETTTIGACRQAWGDESVAGCIPSHTLCRLYEYPGNGLTAITVKIKNLITVANYSMGVIE